MVYIKYIKFIFLDTQCDNEYFIDTLEQSFTKDLDEESVNDEDAIETQDKSMLNQLPDNISKSNLNYKKVNKIVQKVTEDNKIAKDNKENKEGNYYCILCYFSYD